MTNRYQEENDLIMRILSDVSKGPIKEMETKVTNVFHLSLLALIHNYCRKV